MEDPLVMEELSSLFFKMSFRISASSAMASAEARTWVKNGPIMLLQSRAVCGDRRRKALLSCIQGAAALSVMVTTLAPFL